MNIHDKRLSRKFSTADLSRKVGDVTHAASLGPITITHHNKPRFVMMSIEAFNAMKAKSQSRRRVYRTEETPPEVAAWLLPGLERLAEGEGYDDEPGESN